MANKSVINYLEDIEKNTSNNSISQQIGESFMKYLDNASVYYYESDLRKFNKVKRKFIRSSIIILSIILVLLMITIDISIKNNIFDFYILFYLYMMLIKIIDLILISKTPNKRLTSCNLNKEKISFYVHNNKLKEETTNSFVFICFCVISILLFIVNFFVYFINPFESFYNSFAVILLTRFTIPNVFSIKYSEFIFELNDSYVLTDIGLREWKKYDK